MPNATPFRERHESVRVDAFARRGEWTARVRRVVISSQSPRFTWEEEEADPWEEDQGKEGTEK